ncbi:hypothetical protein HG530_012213 [Fusarium avenaceum]|nr:hypothetical protein HG530_012213 [Fusarium avenaceum]
MATVWVVARPEVVGGVEAKCSATIVHQVELDVLATSQLLPVLLRLSVRHILALLDDGNVRGEESLETVLDKGESVLAVSLGLVKVVEEDAANTTGLASVFVVKVLVAPLFESRVVILIVGVAGSFHRLVEVDGVLIEEIRWRQVTATTEPPSLRGTVGVGRLKVSIVEVHCWRHRVVRVQNHAEACSKEVDRLQVGIHSLVVCAHLLNGRLRKRAVNDTHSKAGLLEDIAFLKDAGGTATSIGTLPFVLAKLLAVDSLELGNNLSLLFPNKLFHAEAHRRILGDARLALLLGIAVGESRGVGVNRLEFGLEINVVSV